MTSVRCLLQLVSAQESGCITQSRSRNMRVPSLSITFDTIMLAADVLAIRSAMPTDLSFARRGHSVDPLLFILALSLPRS
jgi:hypothetical protein